MVRIHSFKTGFVLILAALFWAIPSLYAQAGKMTQGNIIRTIDLNRLETDSVLVIKGMLDKAQLTDIRIDATRNSKDFTISIPNTLVDPETFQTNIITFEAGKDLDNITIIERIDDQGDRYSFSIDLIVQGRKILIPEVKHPLVNGEIQIVLTDFERVEREAQKKRAEEEAARMEREKQEKAKEAAARQKQLEEQRRRVEAQQQKAEMRDQTLSVLDQIIMKYQKPSIMQVSILNASGKAKRAHKLSVYLNSIQKKNIEESLGLKLEIVNVSNATDVDVPRTVIFFRENHLKNALFLADLIPGEQKVIPMAKENRKEGVDVEVYIGPDYQ